MTTPLPPTAPPVGLVASALIFMALALAVWATLHQRARPLPVALWAGGALLTAIGLLLTSLRFSLPVWAGTELAVTTVYLGLVLRTIALRAHLQQALKLQRDLSLVLLVTLGFIALNRTGLHELRLIYGWTVGGISTLYLARGAWRAWRISGSRAARLLAWAELQSGASWLIGAALQFSGQYTDNTLDSSLRNRLVLVSLVLAGIYGCLGYLGMLLDDYQKRQVNDAAEAAAAQAARATAEAQASRLLALTEEQARLLAERDRLLHVMAHEVRQPLHNASGVLQALQQGLSTNPAELAQRAARADAVLGRVREVLDNTLVAARLLQQNQPPVLRETDLAFMVALTLLDFPQPQRTQVVLQGLDEPLPALLEPQLCRLALRNLLRNALTHGGPQVQLTVSAEVLPLVDRVRLTVSDNGRGMPLDRLERLQRLQAVTQTPAAPPPPSPPPTEGVSPGLGLQIVRQVAALHGGRSGLNLNPQGGLDAWMELPLPKG